MGIPGFRAFDEDVKSTLLYLMQVLSLKHWSASYADWSDDGTTFALQTLCQLLAILQDRNPSDVRRVVFKLLELKLASIECDEDSVELLTLSSLWGHRKFLEKVLRKNPDFVICLQECGNYDSVAFPRAPLSESLQRIRVLRLYKCEKLERADLSSFPELRSLELIYCDELKAVTGWKVVKRLGWLSIRGCRSFADFPLVECPPCLAEFRFKFGRGPGIRMTSAPDFSNCDGLRRLEIERDSSSLLNSVDISTLRFLEVLILAEFSGPTRIQGLSGLHSLTKLVLHGCEALRGVPELGCLKALTYLDLSGSGVEEIAGVQKLHLLTQLRLRECRSLKTLPGLGHLKALAYLDVSQTGVEEIPGVEDLVSLETLWCLGSRLKRLPDLHHLRRLREVPVLGIPLSMDPSSFYYGKDILVYNAEEGSAGMVRDVSEDSDGEDGGSADRSN